MSWGKYFIFLGPFLFACVLFYDKPVVLEEDPKLYLGKKFPNSLLFSNEEASLALKICFSLRSLRLNQDFQNENLSAYSKNFIKDCKNHSYESPIKLVNLHKGKNSRSPASMIEDFPSDREGKFSQICHRLISGKSNSRQIQIGDKNYFYFFTDELDSNSIIELSGHDTVKEFKKYKIKTDPRDGPIGRIIERRKLNICYSGDRVSELQEKFIYRKKNHEK